MGTHHRPIPIKCWLKFLADQGCEFDHIKASHHIYKKKGLFRPIVIQGALKEISFFHVSTNLKTLGVSKEEFLKWVEKNC